MGAIVCVKMRFPHVVTIFPASFPVACFWGVQNPQIAMYAKGVTFGNLASWKAIVRIFYFIWQKNDWFQTIQMLLLSSWPHLCTFGNLGNPLGLLDPLDPHLSLLDTLLVLSGIFNPFFTLWALLPIKTLKALQDLYDQDDTVEILLYVVFYSEHWSKAMS